MSVQKPINHITVATNYDLRLDIPARTYIGSQLISLLEHGGSLWDAKEHLFSQEQYKSQFNGEQVYSYKLHDHSHALSLLYSLIVVPREILDLPKDHQIYRDLDAENVIALFSVSEATPKDSYNFLRSLRNSVSHALFAMKEHGGQVQYEFWTDQKPILKASIGHANLLKFPSVVGSRLANATLGRK